jgi:hypothetical protein
VFRLGEYHATIHDAGWSSSLVRGYCYTWYLAGWRQGPVDLIMISYGVPSLSHLVELTALTSRERCTTLIFSPT